MKIMTNCGFDNYFSQQWRHDQIQYYGHAPYQQLNHYVHEPNMTPTLEDTKLKVIQIHFSKTTSQAK
jgi:hypothetical protein